MSHLKRQNIPKNWPVPKKGSTFIVRASSKGIPVLVLLRDVLKIARTRKEIKRAIFEKNILVCGKVINDEKKNMELFEVLTLVPSNKNQKLVLSEKGKYEAKEIKESEKDKKISKIINKKVLKKKKVQLNLWDGRNYLTDLKCSVNDSVIIDFKKNKIEKCLELKEKSKIFIIGGKHAGRQGTIGKIDKKLKIAEVDSEKEKINVLIKQLMVIE